MRRTRGTLIGLLVIVLVLGLVNAETPGGRGDGGGFSIGLDDIRRALGGLFGARQEPPRPEPVAVMDLPRRQTAPTGKPMAEPRRTGELTARRTERAKFYQLADGRVQAEVSATPVHYRDARGNLQPIDTRVRPANRPGVSFANETNTFVSSFGTSTDRLATFDLGGRAVSVGAAGPGRPLQPSGGGDRVTFADALGAGADVAYRISSNGLKEAVVLTRPPADSTFVFTLDLDGLTARQRDDGSIGFYPADRDTQPLLVMPRPFMYDSRADAGSPYGTTWSGGVTQILGWQGNRLTVAVTADKSWLADPARVYPVVIDPTIKIQPTVSQSQDAMIVSDDPNGNYDGSWRLSVGTTPAAKARSLVKFDLTGVPAGTQLDSANLQLYFDQDHTTGSFDVPMEARRVTTSWTESTVTWNGINTAMGEVGANVETVDDTDTTKTAINGEWPASTNTALTQYGINGTYRYNNNAAIGETFTWVPRLTESGDYMVEAHYVAAPDRATAAPYTVRHSGGQAPRTVNQTAGTNGVWAGLGTYPFVAGTSHSVVLGDVANKAVIADAVRLTKPGTAVKTVNQSSVWHSYSVRSTVQGWLDGANPNYGFMLKATDEATLGRGGPRYEAAEYAYNGENENTPKLLLTYGKPGVELAAPTKIYSTGAELTWTPYAGSDLVEYQVHRSIYQTFTPTAATLIAPVKPNATTYTDTTATPTPVDSQDPFGQVYYYMVAVKTTDGAVIPAPTQIARLPRAGRIVAILQGDALDTTLSSTESTTGHDVLAGNPWLSVGNNSATYGRTRAVVRFPSLSAIPAGARVLDAEFGMWSVTTIGSGATYNAHALTRTFDEASASWTRASTATAWTTAGGDYNPAIADIVTGNTNDPAWRLWYINTIVQGWVNSPASNNGMLVKLANETSPAERTLFLSSEAPEPQLRPKLAVVYTEPTPAQTYFAPSTSAIRMIPGDLYPIPVTVSNPTASTWTPSQWELSYHWTLPDGTDVTNGGNQLATALPANVAPGGAVDVNAQVRTPIQSDSGNKRHEYVLKWELHNKITGQWLSTTDGIGPLDQDVVVEDPTSDQLGLEKFYAYAGKNTGAGGTLMNNLYAGNTVWSYDALSNPSRGLATFVRLAYNSKDTSDTVAGFGWSLQASSLMRLGTPLELHPNQNPTTVTLTDGDGTSHTFSWDAGAGAWASPKGVHLFLQRQIVCATNTRESRAWVLTRPDRTQFFYDCDGYLSSIEDNNGNVMTFTYEERRSNNKPTKFLRYLTDPVGRQTLAIDYWAKGDTYDYINDTSWTKVSGVANLTNPHIIDHVRTVTDISGRKLTFTYTDKGLLGELIDGVGSTQPKVFAFRYDMTQGNKNVKLVRVTDPRGHATTLDYYSRPEDDPTFKWSTKTYTDRLSNATAFAYTDPDGPQGNTISTLVTDAENHATTYLMDGFGRPTRTTNAKNQTTTLGWDPDNNVVRLEEANAAVSTWVYDQKTGYPTEIKDAEANSHGWAGTTLTYQTGLSGHIADLIAKQSPEGRRWTFGYTGEGDLASVVDPLGNTTPDPNDYKTTYTYDDWGQLLTVRDANGNVTTNSSFHASGYPQTITDALNEATRFVYDERGQVTKVTDALLKDTTQTYDTFGRPLVNKVPKNQAANEFIVTPEPVYDANDNITTATAPNGAVTTAVYDDADQITSTLAPIDETGDPQRTTSFTYDRVGNLLTTTEPKGNLTPDPNDFKTTSSYDEIYQLTQVANANNDRITYTYDNVGNVTTVVDPRKNATPDPNDYTTRYAYDLAHRVTRTTDAMGKFTTSTYDHDGLVTARTDQSGSTVQVVLDARGKPTEVRVPHVDSGGIVYRITKYEYDQVGNRTKVITPRGVATTDDADDFAQVTVYDQLNRVKETQTAFDRDDARYTTPDRTTYGYDDVGRLTRLSNPPSSGETVRNDTTYTYFDNGWTKTSSDPWDIVTAYDYNPLGAQISRTQTSAGGSSNRSMTWQYYPNGKIRSRADEGVPVGRQVVLVDNSDSQNTATTGTWPSATTGAGVYGHNYATHAAGTGTNSFTWKLNVPQAGTYEVFARYPNVSGAATDARYTVTHAAGSVVRTVNQTTNTGAWVSLGSFAFAEGNTHTVSLSDQAGGTVLADALKLVRDNAGEADTERHDYSYRYDPNGNLTTITDASPGARIDTYAVTYTGLNQVDQVQEKLAGVVRNTTTFGYNANGAAVSTSHDRQHSVYEYDVRDLVSRVAVGDTPSDPTPKVTTFTYTDKHERLREVKGNGNTVDHTYFLDGLLRTQVEKKPNQTVVSEHTIDYDLNGNRSRDVTRKMNADNHAAYLTTTADYSYDPRDRIAQVAKTGHGAGAETYVHDANSNVISQTVGGVATSFNYDRNRLLSSTSGGASAAFNYDPFGRLDTITAAGTVVERNVYDGFDHITENRKTSGGATTTTRYSFDPLDRTTTKTTDVGRPTEKTTTFNYLGLSREVLDEQVAASITKSYQYSPWGERLSQTKHNPGGTEEDAYYGYNPHTDVETLTDNTGDTKATYGYTAYGANDTPHFTGIDTPDPADPTREPYNPYRFNAKRWDQNTQSYDMGFRDYSPGLNRFLTRDSYNGALADLNLGLNPFTGNRYAFGGGNPITGIEDDGHEAGSWCTTSSCAILNAQTQTSHPMETGFVNGVAPPVIDVEEGLCVANCGPIDDAVDAYYRENDCVGFTVSNFLGVVGLSPCGKSREELERALLEQVAKEQLADTGPELILPFLPAGAPDNEEIAQRIARHIGSEQARHGFGKLSTDEIAVQIERLLNRFSAGDKGLVPKTLRPGQPDEARVIFDPESGILVVVNPSAPGFGTALGGQLFDDFLKFGL